MAGHRDAVFRMAGIRCRSTLQPGSASGATKAIPICSSPSFPDGVRVEGGYITMPELPGIGFEGKSDLYAEMKSLAA